MGLQTDKVEPDAKPATDLSSLLRDVPSITVRPLLKGFTDRSPEDKLESIRGHNLDVLFRFDLRIIRGGIFAAARYGVWSFHHDDNVEYRGGPPLFWEIYEQNPVSGTILQILTDSLDGGHVIYRGHSSTDKWIAASTRFIGRLPNMPCAACAISTTAA